MVNVEKLEKFLEDWRVPRKKKPILSWEKIPSTLEQDTYPLTENGKVQMYFNMEEAKTGYSLEEVLSNEDFETENYHVITKKRAKEIRFFVEYIPEFDVIAIGKAILNCRQITKANQNEPRFWTSNHLIFITRDKKVIYRPHNWVRYKWIPIAGLHQYDKINCLTPFKLESIPYQNCGINDEDFKEMASPLLKFFQRYCNVGSNYVVDITSGGCCLKDFIAYNEPLKKKGPKQKRIDELVNLPLPEIKYDDTYAHKTAFIQKVKPGMCVLRTTFVDHESKVMIDAARIYITKKEVIACRPNNFGEWVNMVLNSQGHNWDFNLVDFNSEDVENTLLEYFGSIVEDVPNNSKGKLIWGMLTCPIIEQLAKAGFKELMIQEVKRTFYQKALEPIEIIFGKIDDKKKSLTEKLGVNKYQLKRICEEIQQELIRRKERENTYSYYRFNLFSPIIYIKRILSDTYRYTNSYYQEYDVYENISHIDNKTFEIILTSLNEVRQRIDKISDSYYRYNEIDEYVASASLLRKVYNQTTMLNMLKSLQELIGKTIQNETPWGISNQNASIIYKDYLNVIKELGDTSHFRPNFDINNLDTVKQMHDAAVSVHNLKKDEIQAREFESISKSLDKWTYENEKYAVIVPQTPNDIAREGITLHHCAKSYISKMMERITNILFIREKTDIDKPFFTVEVTNDSVIQQVHGFANRNVDTEPGLDEFIKEWVKKKKMKISNFNKIR